MATTRKYLFDNYNGKGFAAEYAKYSERANKDVDGNEITTTYATKAELPDITGKADKVTGGTGNHVVSLDSTGNIKDSGIPATTAAEGTSSLVVTNTTSNNATTTTYEWKGWTAKNIDIPQEFVEIGGKAYPVVTIGSQKWMAENLDYLPDFVTLKSSGLDNSIPAAAYTNYDQSVAQTRKQGLSYNFKAWVAFENATAAQGSTLLPDGWRLPSKNDFDTLWATLGISGTTASVSVIKGYYEWANGEWNDATSNTSGFSACPAGYYNMSSNSWGNQTSVSRYWSTSSVNTYYSATERYGMFLGGHVYPHTDYRMNDTTTACIRLVKDI